MRIKTVTTYRDGDEYSSSDWIGDFVSEQLLHENRNGYSEKVPLEKQPDRVAVALGNLAEFLMKKNLMTLADLHDIIGTDFDLRERTTLEQES